MDSPVRAWWTGFPVEESVCRFLVEEQLEESTANAYSVATVTVGEEAEIADLGEALGKNMDEKAADELVGIESHGSDASCFLWRSRHWNVTCRPECHQAVVGDGNAVGYSGEVIEDLGGSPKGGFWHR